MNNYSDWIRNHREDILRGNNWHDVQNVEIEMSALKESLTNKVKHIMLLTPEEAQYVIEDLLRSKAVSFSTTYAGNIKDTFSATRNLSKFFSYQHSGKIVFTLKGLGIKSTQYAYQGKMYIKITGYSSLRRILNGTRYRINHPKVLEVGIGSAGFQNGIVSGARFCIWFSECWRLIELIFKSENDVASFLGNVTMDVAKVIVTIFVMRVKGKIMARVIPFFLASAAVPVWGGIVTVVALGCFVAWGLNTVDVNKKLSDRLINCIRQGMRERQKIAEWNMHSMGYDPMLYPGGY